jgi:hypothetical protein
VCVCLCVCVCVCVRETDEKGEGAVHEESRSLCIAQTIVQYVPCAHIDRVAWGWLGLTISHTADDTQHYTHTLLA